MIEQETPTSDQGLNVVNVLRVKLKLNVGVRRVGLLIDDDVVGDFAERLKAAGLIGRVLEDNVHLALLEVADADQDQVTWVDPDLGQ